MRAMKSCRSFCHFPNQGCISHLLSCFPNRKACQLVTYPYPVSAHGGNGFGDRDIAAIPFCPNKNAEGTSEFETIQASYPAAYCLVDADGVNTQIKSRLNDRSFPPVKGVDQILVDPAGGL